jgi:hypothetical protein
MLFVYIFNILKCHIFKQSYELFKVELSAQQRTHYDLLGVVIIEYFIMHRMHANLFERWRIEDSGKRPSIFLSFLYV